jgi:putative ABC transport system permease protein
MMLSHIAWRNIWRNKKRTVITIASIALGLACAVFFISLEEGLKFRLEDETVPFMAGHITLEHPEYQDEPAIDTYLNETSPLRNQIEKLNDVKETKPLIIARGVAKSPTSSAAVKIFGVEPDVADRVSPLVSQITAGRYLQNRDQAHIVIGKKLADRLGAGTGKKLVLTTADNQSTITEILCRVVGIFETGLEEIDSYVIHIPLPFIRGVLSLPPDSATQISIILKRPETREQVIQKIHSLAGEKPISVYSWHVIIPELASFLHMISYSVLILESLLILLILFTILNTILMSVLERRKEFAVLLALGTPPAFLKRKIFLESTWIAMLGVALGILIGGLVSLSFQIWGLDLSKVIGDNQFFFGFGNPSLIYARLKTATLVKTSGIILAAVLVITLIPMRWAMKVPVAETLRWEKP